MSLTDDFPFDMADIMGLLSFSEKRAGSNGWYVNCPFCGESKKRMHINLKKKVFRCNRCGESGGMLALYAGVYGIDTKSAYDEILDLLHDRNDNSKITPQKPGGVHPDRKTEKKQNVDGKDEFKDLCGQDEAELAPIEVRNRTYSLLLSNLSLADKHREGLLERGFTEEQIERSAFRSTPVFGFKRLAKKLLDEGCELRGVPGFYQEEDETWTINFNSRNSGFLVPVRDLEGNIQGMQIRLDRPVDSCKYFWFSSIGQRSGVTSGSPVHFVGDPQDKVIYVTEGGLKGDLAHYLSGKSFLCLPGVSQHANLPGILMKLKEQGVKKIYEAYDMDKFLDVSCRQDYGDKCRQCEYCSDGKVPALCPRKELKRKNIQSGCSKLQDLCLEAGLEFEPLVWDCNEDGKWHGNVKGVDDYLVSLARKD